MDDSLIPVNDQEVWDELNHQQSKEIEQHLNAQSHQNGLLQQTFESIKSAASTATSWTYKPAQQTTGLEEFGLPNTVNEDPLLTRYEELPRRPQMRGDFIFLEQFRLQPKRDGWGAVSNLDLFFTSLYNYYYHRGLTPIIGKGIVELVSLFVTLWLSVFLSLYVDWQQLATCHDEDTCKPNFSNYMIHAPFSRLSLWTTIVFVYCTLFTCYGIFSVWAFWHTIKDAFQAKYFFEEKLGISARKLEGGAVDWDKDVAGKLLVLQQSGTYRIAIHDGNLDALVIAQRIMRKENFMVAFFNKDILDITLPFSQKKFFCKTLEWSLYFCVLNYMFNHKYQVRPAFFLDPRALKQRFILCGVAHLVFMPFLLFFMFLHFIMNNAYDWKSTKKYLGPKEWTMVAKWTFREFNELPHFFERRLGPSYEAADDYLKLFTQSEIMTTLGRIMAFLGGSFGGILLVFAAINDAILFNVKIGPWNLLWYGGVMGVIYSVGKGMLPNPDIHPRYVRNLFAEMDTALEKVSTHTHHFPDTWKGRGWDGITKAVISGMFNSKAHVFLEELLALILAPYILCISLPRSAEKICEFVMMTKTGVSGTGDVCGYATFDFDGFGDENFEGRTIKEDNNVGDLASSIHQLNDVEAAVRRHPKPKARYGKMEKSFFSFKACHPSWKSTASGQSLLDRVENFKAEETFALLREQQHHVHAAARQLETLAMLEKKMSAIAPPPVRIDEGYIIQSSIHQSRQIGTSHMNPTISTASNQICATTDEQSDVQGIDNDLVPPFAHHNSHNQHFKDQSSEISRRSNGKPWPAKPLDSSSLHFVDTSLSTELRNVLNRSTLDTDVGEASAILGKSSVVSLSGGQGQLASLVIEEMDDDSERRTQQEVSFQIPDRDRVRSLIDLF